MKRAARSSETCRSKPKKLRPGRSAANRSRPNATCLGLDIFAVAERPSFNQLCHIYTQYMEYFAWTCLFYIGGRVET